jgi:phytoene desaturase
MRDLSTYPDPDQQADAIVIGAGIGGLASAMRLGAKGYRVTVIDRLDMPGGRGSAILDGGHRFDLGPTIVTVPQGLRDLWATCGRDFDSDVTLVPMDPFYEIRWPDGSKFTMRGDKAAMAAEVARLSPKDSAGYARFLRDAEARYQFGFENLRMALSFHPLFIGGDPFHVTSMYALVSHLEAEFGVHYAMGGVAAIAAAMARVIEGQGGVLRLNTEVDEVVVERGRAAGVRLVGGEVLRAPLVVSNADAGHTYDRLLRNAPRRRWTAARLKRTRWSMGLFVWYFGTKGTAGMWRDVGHHTILNGPRYKGLTQDIFIKGKLADDMSLYVHRPSVTDPSCAPAGDDTFYALSPVPHLGHDNGVDWAEMGETYRLKVQKVLEDQLLPGFSSHLTSSRFFTPLDFRDRYLSPYGAGFSIEPRILQSAWFRPHNVSEELPGLYLTGAGTHPGAGVPGVIASAEVLGKLIPDAPVSARTAERLAAE